MPKYKVTLVLERTERASIYREVEAESARHAEWLATREVSDDLDTDLVDLPPTKDWTKDYDATTVGDAEAEEIECT